MGTEHVTGGEREDRTCGGKQVGVRKLGRAMESHCRSKQESGLSDGL